MTRNLFAALAVVAALALPATIASAKDDRVFMREAIQGNLAEINMGRLAQRRSRNADVKAYGKMLVDEHSAANERAQAVARQIGVRLPMHPSMRQRLGFGYYAVLRGAIFDRQFIRHMIDDHRKVIRAYEEQAKSGSGPVAELARDTLPTLQEHLRAAQDLQGRLTAQKR